MASEPVPQLNKRAGKHPCQNQKNNHASGDNMSDGLDAELSKFLTHIKTLKIFSPRVADRRVDAFPLVSAE